LGQGLVIRRIALYLKALIPYPVNEITFQLGKTESVEVNPKKGYKMVEKLSKNLN